MPITERFDEANAILGQLVPASYSSEQNIALFNVSGYEEIFVLIQFGAIGTTLDVDIEVARDADATGLLTLDSITQLSVDNGYVGLSIQAEKLVNPTGGSGNYDWMRIEVTPSGACLVGVIVFGVNPKYKPVDVTGYDELIH